MLFQKRVMRIKFDIYVLIVVFSLTRLVLEAAIYCTRALVWLGRCSKPRSTVLEL